jgi:TonB family protein
MKFDHDAEFSIAKAPRGGLRAGVDAPEAHLPPERGRNPIGWWALAAAILLHLVPVVLWLLPYHRTVRHPPEITVTLVHEVPKPKPPAPRTPPTPPEQASLAPRMSGADEKTEALKDPNKPVPSLPRAASQPKPDESRPSPTGAKPLVNEPAAPKQLFIRLPAQGGAAARDLAGDPYLNHIMQILEQNRVYPAASEFYGAPERLVIYNVVIEPAGRISTMFLVSSSGSTRIDEAARQMITDSAPFPPLPSDFPQTRTAITMALALRPH